MDRYSLAQFLTATLFILMTSGPVMAMVVSQHVARRNDVRPPDCCRRRARRRVLARGNVRGLALSGELLPVVFRWLSLAGALYLIWLAAEALLVRRRTSRKLSSSRCRKPILEGLTIAFANPAALLIYTAFFPQFIDPDHSISEQMIVLSAVYVCTALAFDSACVLTVARLPAGWTQPGRFAEVGSAVLYLSIAVVTVLRFVEALG